MVQKQALALDLFLNEAHQSIFGDRSGAPADYIPELAKVDPEQFGIAITTSDGVTHEIGETSTEFTIQSISKAFVYSLALELLGSEKVTKAIGIEPSGEAFNSIRLNPENRPFNPMVNSGAIACTALICRHYGDEAFEKIAATLGDFAGRKLLLDEKVYSSENATGDRNRAISWLLKNNDNLHCDVEEVLGVYFRQCSLLVTASDLSVMGATLSNKGVNPVTGKKVIGKTASIQTMSVMVSAGMYDYSGEWTFKVGLPAKSGVGGGITAVLPSQFGLGVFSPPLDKLGNSVRGVKVCEMLSEHFNLHVLKMEDDVTQNIPIKYDLSKIRSSRSRSNRDNKILEEFGSQAIVLELSGVVNFIGSNFISRSVVENEEADYIILSFKRVARLTSASIEVFRLFFSNFSSTNTQLVVVGKEDSDSLFGDITGLIKEHTQHFETLDQAIDWAEDRLIARYDAERDNSDDPISMKQQPLLKDLSSSDLELLEQNTVKTQYERGAKIIESGDKADGVYFLQAGRVNVMLNEHVYIAGLDKGTCFGELALIAPDAPRSADVIAETDAQCSFLSIENVERISSGNPKIRELLLRNLGLILFERLQQSNSKISALSVN